MKQIIVKSILILFIPELTLACATCFGAPDAPATEGMNWAIITLLVVTGGVLSGIIKSIISISNRTKAFHQKNNV